MPVAEHCPIDFTLIHSVPCRFGFDVPVILRSSDESESVLPVPEKRMVQVTNPFALEVGSGVASITGKNTFTHQRDFGTHGLLLEG